MRVVVAVWLLEDAWVTSLAHPVDSGMVEWATSTTFGVACAVTRSVATAGVEYRVSFRTIIVERARARSISVQSSCQHDL